MNEWNGRINEALIMRVCVFVYAQINSIQMNFRSDFEQDHNLSNA